MRRKSLIVCMLASVPFVVTAAAPASKLPAMVKVVECVIVDDGESGRSATFRGEMTALPKTARMQMRFTLLQKPDKGGTIAPLSTPALSGWRKSKPGVKYFSYDQRVVGLQSGSTYRAAVTFKWMRANGKTIARVTKRSGGCHQPGELPNLTVTNIARSPGPRSGTTDYGVDVTNSGRSAARNVRVVLRVDGALLDMTDISTLAPGETSTVHFTGPACARNVRAVVDPEDAIRESGEADNALQKSCRVR
jgi:hypothetical protein